MATDVAATRAFFGPRAAGWEDRFPDDGPAYRQAVAEMAVPAGGVALDAGCGTGRALPPLRAAVGERGTVLAVDLTTQMLGEAARLGRDRVACLVLADTTRLPLADGSVDVVFAGGLLPHLPDPVTGLAELARVTRTGGLLALFQPIGRAALARRRGHEPDPDDLRADPAIRRVLAGAGWAGVSVDDAEDRYLAVARRCG